MKRTKMKPKNIEAKIDKLRKEHTEAFLAQDWSKAQGIRGKIISLWQQWDKAVEVFTEERAVAVAGLTTAQAKLKKLHGTPEFFEKAIWEACGEISVDEARAAIEKYNREWKIAGTITY